MSSSFQGKSSIFPFVAVVVIIIIAIAVTAAVQGTPTKAFSQIITVGPLWETDTWSCTSDQDFMLYMTLRANEATSQILISVSDVGTQSLYDLNFGELETFSIGSPEDGTILITRTGIVTGFITLQTTSDAVASCTAI